MTEYSRQIYDPRGFAYPSNDDDDDHHLHNDDGDGGSNSEATPSYQPRRKRHFW